MLFQHFIRIIKSNLFSKDPIANQSSGEHYTQSDTYANYRQQNRGQASAYTGYSMQEKTYYDALEVKAGATFTEIKASYKLLVKKYHPDLFYNNPEKRRYAEMVTQKINEAYNYFEKQNEKKA